VLNYYAVNPQYGSMDDFKNLLKQAHQKGIRIIIDLVLNHTSSQHPWFVDANANPNATYRDWYVWSETGQGNHWYKSQNSYYYAYFWEGMPDLNYNNPNVTAQMEKVSAYWLTTIGVDGFRIDAAKHLIEEGNKLENTPTTHTWFKNYEAFYKAEKPDAYVVGEVSGAGGLIAKTYAGQMDQIFNFELANAIVNSVIGGGTSSVTSAFKFALQEKPDGNYATFLTNHDQNRVMGVLNSLGKAKVAASLLLTAPGTPFIYYGEEVGMKGQKPDEDIRLPMQWTADPLTAGFTTGTPWRAPQADTVKLNVSAEEQDPVSLLNHYRALTALRKQYPSLRTGSLTLLETGHRAVFASLRVEEQQTILVLVNLSGEPVSDYRLSLADSVLPDATYSPAVIFGSGTLAPLQVSNGKFDAYLPQPELAPFFTIIALINR
jgi:glycosidase